MIATPDKVRLQEASAVASGGIAEQNATRAALGVAPEKECRQKTSRPIRIERAVDLVRGLRVWDVELLNRRQVPLAGHRGCRKRQVLNVSDLSIARSRTRKSIGGDYPSGDLFSPDQVVSTGNYTRNDRRLEHDFFYMMNDHRCEGVSETACGETSFPPTGVRPHMVRRVELPSFARPGARTATFDLLPGRRQRNVRATTPTTGRGSFPNGSKPSLDAMGFFQHRQATYPRVLMITDACRSGSVHNASFQVTTEDNKGEGTNVIRIAHRNPATPSNHNAVRRGRLLRQSQQYSSRDEPLSS